MIPAGYETALAESLDYFVYLAVRLGPLFIGASFLVGLAKEYLPPERVEETLRAHDEGGGNVAAAGFGAVTPFCSCSTVPILAGLIGAGAPLGLAFSFLLASPLVNWIAVLLLFGLFGPLVTVAYVVTTLTAAIVGGILIGRLELTNYVKNVRITAGGREITTDPGSATGTPDASTDGGVPATDVGECGCGGSTTKSHRSRIVTAGRGALSFFWSTLPYLIAGIAIGALIHGAVPTEILHRVAGPENPLATPLAAVAGAPIYVGMSGMLPIAAALFDQGIQIGTVLAFVIGGAGVSIPNLILLNKLFERRLLVIYAGTVVTIGITVGVLFNAVLI